MNKCQALQLLVRTFCIIANTCTDNHTHIHLQTYNYFKTYIKYTHTVTNTNGQREALAHRTHSHKHTFIHKHVPQHTQIILNIVLASHISYGSVCFNITA